MINDWSIIKVVSNIYIYLKLSNINTTKITKFIIQSRFEKIETIEKQVAQSLLIQWQSDHVFKKKEYEIWQWSDDASEILSHPISVQRIASTSEIITSEARRAFL